MIQLFLLAIISPSHCTAGPPKTKPNIVFILADDFGYNDIGYNARKHESAMQTPFLDILARDGIKLENYYVQPICSPTRSQLMSGRYQIHTGLQHSYIHPMQPNGLPLDNIILPEQLRECGYDTHMVGKWHLGSHKMDYVPWKRGFNSYFGYLTGGEDYYTKWVCSFPAAGACGVDMWNSSTGPDNTTWGQYSANLFTEKAKRVINTRNKEKPLFLYLAFQSVHAPMEAPAEYVKPFTFIKDHNRRIYGGMVSAMDQAVMNLTLHLEEAGLLDNTIIIFSTDNGGQTLGGGNNWPLRGRKLTLWEGGVKGVGFLYGKPLGVQGIGHNKLIHVSDWLPTILSASQCPIVAGTPPLDGMDQWNAILQQEDSPRDEILHNIDPLFPRLVTNSSAKIVSGFDTSVHAAVRWQRWKLLTGDPGFADWVRPPEAVQKLGGEESLKKETGIQKLIQLYDIEADPYEMNEISAEYPEIVTKLLVKLVEYNRTAVPVLFPADDPLANPKYHNGFWGPWLT